MRAVNLLPRDAKRSGVLAAQNLPALLGACVGVLVVGVLAAGFLVENSKVASARHALDQAKQELAGTPLPPAAAKPAPSAPAVAATEQPLLQAVSSALSQRIAWDRILREFSLVLPSDVWLNSLMFTTPVAATATTPATGLQVAGTTYSYDSVARLLSRLALVPDLTGVTLSNSTRTGRLVQFTVNAGVKGAPAPPAAPAAAATDTTATTPGASQ